ncbi:sugar ABC transporter ATP-binding protein [Sinanaerobacter chloroacetimidivorans]|jgi:ribose transport system ATP-binding protein|uniref:Sugar ABC transporter ATP-binding protein n=1 Tax=Sinanaerobacter chloroacetimidivorans TaxID=2818044 RepID=A0A8J7W5D6_9FIRM|nr:sugar ABC transporter ATP-binding protein [Sinanaerobacter chloroacetimidivorans]MBR0599668.1 sugar ABC transporter ATP-binding protein [Sinanaerobacter chloroacetimidivorans]
MLLQTKKLCKQFGGIYALKDIDFEIMEGETLGLVGENGAGKSTLIKILTGVYSLDSGGILWDGKAAEIHNPCQSRDLGINVIHQDRNLIPAFSGIENIYLGLEYEKKAGIAVNWAKMKQRVEEVMTDLGVSIDLELPAALLTPPQKTMIEIVRAMMTQCKLLILDEPTASLTDRESEMLFEIIGKLKKKGTSILYVTHRMDEIFRLTDRITVFKNGQLVNTVETAEVNKEKIISMMTDNWVSEKLKTAGEFGEVLLNVEHLASKDNIVKDASFTVHAGEILGIFGLGGSGRTELLECVYGYRPVAGGKITLEGAPIGKPSPANSLRKGMVLICEDRRGKALVGSLNVKQNIVLSTIDRYAHFGVVDEKKEISDAEGQIDKLNIKTEGPKQPVLQLSGGNQQKVVFAKALMSNPKVLLCDEPSQAVDVKTRQEIHKLLRRKAEEGNAVVFVSSDLKEVLEVVDHVLIMANGKTREFFVNDGLTAEQVLAGCYAD